METIKIQMANNTHLMVECEDSTREELKEFFSFFAPDYQHMPLYKNKAWDGKIRLFNTITRQLPVGLYERLRYFCVNRGYKLKIIESTKYGYPSQTTKIDLETFATFVKNLGLPFTPRPYQLKSAFHALTHRRRILLSPTASGKSLVIYLMVMWYLDTEDEDILIMVPTTTLVEQMYKDFEEYGMDAEKYCAKVYSDTESSAAKKEKSSSKRVVISTWQSLQRTKTDWFQRFGMVIGDEAHHFKGKTLTAIMNKNSEAHYRIGTTGSLDNKMVNQLVLEGVFGPVHRVISTKELQDKGYIADLKITMFALGYSAEDRQKVGKARKHKGRWYPMTYQEEIDFLIKHKDRNQFICDVVDQLEGNTIVLYRYVETHGEVLYNMIADQRKNVYYVHGNVDTSDREAIRAIVETKSNAVIVASEGTFSTGINIRNIHNVVFASPTKSQIRVLQSIGRGLRKADNDQQTTLIDIIDDLRYNGRNNYALVHANDRRKIYRKERFTTKLERITL